MNTDYLRRPATERLREWKELKASHPVYNNCKPTYYLGSQSFWGGQFFKCEDYNIYGRWAENPEETLRCVGFCDEIRKSIDHKGWYTDNDQQETTRGIVYRLNHGRGFAWGYTDEVNFNDKTKRGPVAFEVDQRGNLMYCDDESIAARYADKFAERHAEDSREWDAKQKAEDDIGLAEAEIEEARDDAREIIKALRTTTLPDVLCGVVREKLGRVRRTSHKAFKRIKERKSNHWSAIHNY